MKPVPKKHQPKGFDIIYEDLDLIVGNKSPGLLTVAAKWESENTVHNLLNQYVRKGSARSNKCVFVVHRLDQGTSGILIFAKNEAAQNFLKDNWKSTVKTYYAIVHGNMPKPSGRISSYLSEDEDYVIHSSPTDEAGRLSHTEYEVLRETEKMSLLKVNLVTGRKNQIRVHLADEGHPIVGDNKYGKETGSFKNLALHSSAIEFTHPFKKNRVSFEAPVPKYSKLLSAIITKGKNMQSPKDPILDFANPGEYSPEQVVELLVKEETDLGYKAIVNGKHWGVLYKNEVFQTLEKNQVVRGYIKKLREDGRIDLTLYKSGHRGADDIGPQLLTMLNEGSGFLAITDKTSPETIYEIFGVSKKKFKIALSGLYKKRMITVEPGGIRLVSSVRSNQTS